MKIERVKDLIETRKEMPPYLCWWCFPIKNGKWFADEKEECDIVYIDTLNNKMYGIGAD